MGAKKEVINVGRNKYIYYDFQLWRFRLSYFKMKRKCDIRIAIRLGEEW